jgi:hypothetical protein
MQGRSREDALIFDDLGNIAYIFFKYMNSRISIMTAFYAGLGSEIVEQKLKGPVGSSVRHPHRLCELKTMPYSRSYQNVILSLTHDDSGASPHGKT